MTEERKSPGLGFWCAAVAITLPVLYIFSLAPLLRMESRGMLPADGRMMNVLWVYGLPVRMAYEYGPEWVQKALDYYRQVCA